MVKSIKVHDDTHRALKELKSSRRSKSFDQVVREMISEATGVRVGDVKPGSGSDELTKYLQ